MKKRRSERRMFRWNLKHLGHGLWWGDLNLPLWCVPAGPHGQHTQASTQRNDENGAAWWAHLEDQLQAGGRLRWLLWVGGSTVMMSPGTSAWPGREWRRQFFDSTQEELGFEIDVCGHGELGMVHRRLQVHESPGAPWPTNAIAQNWRGYAATRAFSAKGGPLLRTHWPKNSGKICDHTNSHQAHVWSISWCTGWRIHRPVKFLGFTQYWAEKFLI